GRYAEPCRLAEPRGGCIPARDKPQIEDIRAHDLGCQVETDESGAEHGHGQPSVWSHSRDCPFGWEASRAGRAASAHAGGHLAATNRRLPGIRSGVLVTFENPARLRVAFHVSSDGNRTPIELACR